MMGVWTNRIGSAVTADTGSDGQNHDDDDAM